MISFCNVVSRDNVKSVQPTLSFTHHAAAVPVCVGSSSLRVGWKTKRVLKSETLVNMPSSRPCVVAADGRERASSGLKDLSKEVKKKWHRTQFASLLG